MDYLTGGGLVVLGLVILVFGRTGPGTAAGTDGRTLHWRHWINTVLTWAIGVSCVWFGAVTLIKGRVF